MGISLQKTSRYQERKKAHEKLKRLEIVDVGRSPQSILSHGLLTRDTHSIDILGAYGVVPTQKAALENIFTNKDKEYKKRKMPQKLDLDLTILTVAEQQRGGGSHVRANNEQNFLP